MTTNLLEKQFHETKLDERLRQLSTASPKLTYFDEDVDLNFINSDKSLLNTTEQTIYVVCIFLFEFLSTIFYSYL